jgi:predicted nucleotidyltransferase
MKASAPQSALRNPLNKILGSEAQIRVLRALIRHGEALSVPRVALDAGLSPQGVRNALEALTAAGVVATLGSGRTRLFRLDLRHPLAWQLESLFLAESDRVEKILTEINGAVQAKEIIGAWIYGSYARGQDEHDSDLDLAVLTGERDPHLIDKLREDLDKVADRLRFTPSVVSITLADVERMTKGDPWWQNLVREAIVVKGGRPDTLALDRRTAADRSDGHDEDR